MTSESAVIPKPGLEDILFQSPSVTIGTFRCPADHPMFKDSGPSNAYCFVFPRTTVWIERPGEQPFLADPRVVTFYNEGQVYSRRKVSDEGDRAEWFGVTPEIAAEVLTNVAPEARGRGRRVFGHAHGSSDAVTYLSQRRLVEECVSNSLVEPLDVEERVVGLLARVARGHGAAPRPSAGADSGRKDFAEDARLLVGATLTERVLLSDLAAALECSVFYLCHRFRKIYGTTIQAYRQDLRLRASLERLRGGDRNITAVALDLGFSSHSHFTAAFRRHFGVTPSSFVARLAGRPDRRGDDEHASGPVTVERTVG